MSDAIELVAADQLLEVHATGKLTKAFYQELMPAVERQIEHFGKLRILFVMNDFHGWMAGAMWKTESSTGTTARKSSGWQSSVNRSGKRAWPRSVSPSPRPRSSTSTTPISTPSVGDRRHLRPDRIEQDLELTARWLRRDCLRAKMSVCKPSR